MAKTAEELGYVYNSFHLHMYGEKRLLTDIGCSITPDDELTESEAQEFYSNGFFIVESAVNEQSLIDHSRFYIDEQYTKWRQITKRQDDWRCHFDLDFDGIEDTMVENAPVLRMILNSSRIQGRLRGLLDEPCGSFYTQVAYRTPVSKRQRQKLMRVQPSIEDKESDEEDDAQIEVSTNPMELNMPYMPGAEYHIDGQANGFGVRFPDNWTVLIGIALVDLSSDDMGNFTVFPGAHTSRSWSNYAEEKMSQTLPHLGDGHKICLKAGSAVFVHVLLPHRGGMNISDPNRKDLDQTLGEVLVNGKPKKLKNIPKSSREMVFYRIKKRGVDYLSLERSRAVIADPWIEHKSMMQKFIMKDLCNI